MIYEMSNNSQGEPQRLHEKTALGSENESFMNDKASNMTQCMNEGIPALQPRTGDGAQFVFYGDCCSGIPGEPFEDNFSAVNCVLAQLCPPPEFILFSGDHVYGLTNDYEELRRQWRHWHEREMEWLAPSIPHFPATSNHNTYDTLSESVWREVFHHLPQNGPPGQEGLTYYMRRGPLLLVSVNTSFSGLDGAGHVECEWLDQVFKDNADASYKLVFGHHPIHTVNGYTRYPHWRIVPDQAEAFWAVLVRHGVVAYLCSHIIAFDVQVHEGVLQICSGGAGTNYGPNGFMPGPEEYLHAVQAAVDAYGLRYRTIDTARTPREWLNWPLCEPPMEVWKSLETTWTSLPAFLSNEQAGESANVKRFRFSGVAGNRDSARETLLCGWHRREERATIEVAIEYGEVVVDLVPRLGEAPIRWKRGTVEVEQEFSFELLFHPAMGPGGILFRTTPESSWSSLKSTCAIGMAQMSWPDEWQVGMGASGLNDAPFRGRCLKVAACSTYTVLED